ncbi:MAG: hypothetical protein U0736_03870 [Gemmataceae bacterium]
MPRLTNSLGMEFALIPPGGFWLGSPENEDGRYSDEGRAAISPDPPVLPGDAVTQDEYQRLMG